LSHSESRISGSVAYSTSKGGAGPIGTPGWAAPEAMEGKVVRASDVFGYGTMLWELLTWRPPSLLVSIKILCEEPLCYLPEVIEVVQKYIQAKPYCKDQKGFNFDDNSDMENSIQLKSNPSDENMKQSASGVTRKWHFSDDSSTPHETFPKRNLQEVDKYYVFLSAFHSNNIISYLAL
jgi:serine/threonine protein kinase